MLTIGQVDSDQVERKHGRQLSETGDNIAGPLRPNDRNRFLAIGKRKGVEHAWQSGNVIRMPMRDANQIESLESPAGRSPRDLDSLAAIQQDQLASDPHQGA